MKRATAILLGLCLPALVFAAKDKNEAPRRFRHQITGLFSIEREADLREAFEKLPDIKLVSIDFANAEATLEYVPAKVFANVKPAEAIARLDNLLRTASGHTFGVKPLRTVPREKLQRIEIRVAGLDCKACSLAAYEAVFRLDGVETATASFREGRVTALIDPAKTNRTRLEAALKQRGVDVKAP
jgi:copper chaperone CopZ